MELTLYTQNNALDYVQFFDFTTEELVVFADLSACSGASQNFISIGQNIGSWSGNNLHFYYYPENDRLLVQCMQGGSAQNIDLSNVNGSFSDS